ASTPLPRFKRRCIVLRNRGVVDAEHRAGSDRMSDMPWGPHGPINYGPPTAMPNPTAQMPLQGPCAPIGMPPPVVSYSSDYSSSGSWAVPGQGAPIPARSLGGDFVLNVLFVGVLWEVWVLLYPLAAAIGWFGLLYGAGLARRL